MTLLSDIAEPRIRSAQPRAVGAARIAARARDGRTVLHRLRHSGSAKALFPRGDGPALDAVLLNTAGGVTGGDRFETTASAAPGAWLRLASQTAERGYRAQPGEEGRLSTTLHVAAGGRIDWLPQETILFDGAAIRRRLEATLTGDARLLAVEPLVFGRAAMGEAVRALRFHDRWTVTRDGVVVFADAIRIVGDAAAQLARPAVANGARALATILYVGPDAADRLAPARAALDAAAAAAPDAVSAGASLIRSGVLSARIVAADGRALRAALMPVLSRFGGAALPKVWML